MGNDDYNDRFRRNKKPRNKRGGKGGWGPIMAGPGMSGPGSGMVRADMGLPSDEELEREAAELERAIKESGPPKDTLSMNELQRMSVDDVHAVAVKEGLSEFQTLPKPDLIFKILKARAMKQGIMIGEGTLEVMQDGFGFLRSSDQSYLPGPDDIYISATLIRRWGLRRGMIIRGVIRPPISSPSVIIQS